MHNPYVRQTPRVYHRFTSVILLLFASSAVGAEADVPLGAERQELAPNVVIVHWTEMAPNGSEKDIRGKITITKWPDGCWGAEVLMTPIPDCCGANPRTVRWRKSEPQAVRHLGTIDAGSKYQLTFRFK